jgi:hypothetical protein
LISQTAAAYLRKPFSPETTGGRSGREVQVQEMMTEDYEVVLFHSVSYALKAEKILKAGNISYKLIPVPRHISSDCGFCVRFPSPLHEQVVAALKDAVEYVAIRPL